MLALVGVLMTIDTRDLPAVVGQAVAALDTTATPSAQADWLRLQAVYSYQAIGALWHTRQWPHVIDQLALVSGYVTAAMRVEEDGAT